MPSKLWPKFVTPTKVGVQFHHFLIIQKCSVQVCIRCYAKQSRAKDRRPDEGRGPVLSFPNHLKMQCASLHSLLC